MHRHVGTRAIIIGLGLVLTVAAGSRTILDATADDAGMTMHAPVRQFVSRLWAPTAAEMATLDRGAAIVKTLPASVSEEIAFIGAVHLTVSPARFVERFRELERLDAGRGIRRLKRFSEPASLDDLKALELGPDDLKALRACVPGDCDLKLPSSAIARFQREVDWNAADASARAARILREVLLTRLAAYRRDGDAALDAYHDRETPLHGGQSVKAALARDTLLAAHLPQLLAYVRDFPRAALPGAEDFYFWSDVEFGLKPTLRLNHVTIYRAPPNAAGIAYAIVTKQLFASHYFQSAVEVRFLVEDGRGRAGASNGVNGIGTSGTGGAGGTGGTGGCYLVCWINARSDGMTGVLGPIVRLQVRRKSRAGLVDYLERAKQRVERNGPA